MNKACELIMLRIELNIDHEIKVHLFEGTLNYLFNVVTLLYYTLQVTLLLTWFGWYCH